MKDPTKRNSSFLLTILFILLILLTSSISFAWEGKVVDKNTGTPIEGVVIVRSWNTCAVSPGGTVDWFEFCDETLSDKEGKFRLSTLKKISHINISLFSWIEENKTIVFKPGYEFMVLETKEKTLELIPIHTFLESRKEQLERAKNNYELGFLGFYDTVLFRDMVIREREFVDSLNKPVKISSYRPAPVAGGTPIHPSKIPSMPLIKNGNNSGYSSHFPFGSSIRPTEQPISYAALSPDELIEIIKKESEVELIEIGAQLAINKDETILRRLIEALGDNNPETRRKIVFVLGEMRDPAAVEPLIKSLSDENSNVSVEAGTALGKIGQPAVESLIIGLNNSNKHVQSNAARALGTIGDPSAIEPLITLLRQGEIIYLVKVRAAEALGNFKDARGVDALIKSFDYKGEYYQNYQSELSRILRIIGQPAVEPLINLLKSEDPNIRKKVVKVLGDIRDERAVLPLIQRLEDEDIDVRINTIEALAKSKDIRVIDPLFSAWNDDSTRIRARAAEAIIHIGLPALDMLRSATKDPDPYIRWRAAYCLGWIKEGTDEGALIDLLYDKVPKVRWTAIDALGKVGSELAYKDLFDLREDEDLGLAEKAGWAMDQIKKRNSN